MKFRHKLLLFGLGVAGVTALAVFLAGGAVIRASVADRVRERLDREIEVLADELVRSPDLLPPPAQGAQGGAPAAECEPCEAFAHSTGERLGLRVTVIALNGTVLGDSSLAESSVVRLENHAHRPEIVAARADGYGASTRDSATVGEKLRYVAKRVDRDGRPAGFVRLAVALTEIQRVTGSYSTTLALVSFAVLLVVAIVGYAAARRFSRPIEVMSLVADEVAAGRRDIEIEYEADDEIGALGSAMNRMTRSLSEQIRALSSEKKLMDTILGGMKEGILVLDRDRHVLLANQAIETVLGLRARAPEGRTLIEVTRDLAVLEAFEGALDRAEETREVIRAAGLDDRSFELTVAPLMDAGGDQIGAIGIFFDMTRMRALESVRRTFVADVSHELRTPLTSIKAFVETLLAGGLEDTSNNRRFLEIVKKHADRMEAILDDLTDLSRIETGASALEPARLDLAPVAREIAESLRPKAESRRVSVTVDVPPGTFVTADRRRLEQVLLNLIDNGIKFNREGGTVSVGARAVAGPPPLIEVVVEDTGIGIPDDSLEKIFHRFYRVEKGRSREMGGTGLGLAIVKHLMRLHGGAIRVESQQGRGSRFILEFPAEEPGSNGTA